MNKRVLVAGKTGQLARELRNLREEHPSWHFLGRDVLDYQDFHSSMFENTLMEWRPSFFINTAAYTKVDDAEDNQQIAEQVNAHIFKDIIPLLNKHNVHLLHFSTDYVFNGQKLQPYSENDQKDPLNTYGRSKSLGEDLICSLANSYSIFRVSWLYSPYGANFVKTMLSLSQRKDDLNIVSDQVGAPTAVSHLAQWLLTILETLESEKEIYHLANSGSTNWANFAKTIFHKANRPCTVHNIKTYQYPYKALRPLNSCLDCSKAIDKFKLTLAPWEEALSEELERMEAQRD